MTTPTVPHDDPLDRAVARLDGAMTRIERMTLRLRQRAESSQAAASIQIDYDQDRQRLAEALDASKAREAALEEAAQHASDALDRAIDDLRQYAAGEG
ncbi:DUF4164 family protein [Maricaulis sp.]|uniref:DUF4164 family protein n=1 Tax=Maricaulis sp. TaxID=1486257 RepID=UPI00260267D9|nr:DUF4164 family protein [Maricaulis sp.]